MLIHATSRWERFVAILVAALCSLPRHTDLALGLQEEDGSRGKPILGRHGGDALHLKGRERLRPGRVLQRCLPQHDRLLLPLRNRHHGIWNGLSVEESIIAGIENGLYDAYTHTQFDLQTKYIDMYPDADIELGTVNLMGDDMDCGTYAVLKKGNTDLQEEFDAAIKELRDDGTIKELCEKWFGADYSVKPE